MNNKLKLFLIVVLISAVGSAYAANSTAIDCAKKSLATELAKLDKLEVNALEVSGTCNEDIVINDFANLTLTGVGGAEITGANTVTVKGGKVTLQALTFNSSQVGITCTDRSVCVLIDVAVICGGEGINAQNQSAIDILGNSTVSGCGVAAFGASSINLRPLWPNGFDPEADGPVITGPSFSCVGAQDGSFLRSDNATFSGCSIGATGRRNATLKMFDYRSTPLGINNSAWVGVWLESSSTAQIGLPITDTGGPGIELGPLSFVQSAGVTFSNNLGPDVLCDHPTAVAYGGGLVCAP